MKNLLKRALGVLLAPSRLVACVQASDAPVPPFPVNLCIDCKHRISNDVKPDVIEFSVCMAPQNMVISRVTGHLEPRVKFCGTQRSTESEGVCGQSGLWWASLWGEVPA